MVDSAPDDYRLSFDRSEVDIDAVHAFLTASYWSPGISRERVARAVAGSLCVSAYAPSGAQVGFARAVTDYASFAYLADVYVVPEHGGRGLARKMTQALLDHPEMQTIRRWMLATRDAHGVYEALGFHALEDPTKAMEYRPPRGQFPPA